MTYPTDIDTELIPFLDELNKIEGLETKFSCCGHDEDCFYVWFKCNDINVEHVLIERFSRITHLGFHFYFDKENSNEFGMYSNVLGNLPNTLRKSYYEYLIIQCRKIRNIMEYDISDFKTL